ncbi:hypothetical protein IW256_003421 [Actinomadura viridis]|uniref:Uncharacterized protein n=1 Tax=Actinomadura viridis TaxID=58110 RepID=A0A931DIQ4_9ACTN|nr:hypothetical protein [Actinomadura viridis]
MGTTAQAPVRRPCPARPEGPAAGARPDGRFEDEA